MGCEDGGRGEGGWDVTFSSIGEQGKVGFGGCGGCGSCVFFGEGWRD